MNESQENILRGLREMARAALASDPLPEASASPAESRAARSAPSAAAEEARAVSPALSADDAALLLDRALGRLCEERRYIP